MILSRYHVFTALALLQLVVSLAAQSTSPASPAVTESFAMEDYRRIWGDPRGCFYFLRSNGVEIRQFISGVTSTRPLSGNEKLISSPAGEYYALVSYASFSPTSLAVSRLALYDCPGNLIWSIDEPAASSFILCEKRPLAAGIEGAEGLPRTRLHFYDTVGHVTGDVSVDYYSGGQFTADGRFFFALSGGAGLLKFSSDGHELARYPDCRRYFTSDDGRCVAVLSDSLLMIYSESREPVKVNATPLTLRALLFSQDGAGVSLLFNDSVVTLSLDSGSVVWSYRLVEPGYQFFHFDADSALTTMVCGASNSIAEPEARNTRGLVVMLDAGGRLLWESEIEYADWSVKYPDVRIAASSRLITLLTASGLQLYRY